MSSSAPFFDPEMTDEDHRLGHATTSLAIVVRQAGEHELKGVPHGWRLYRVRG
jgi:hypothetical protein